MLVRMAALMIAYMLINNMGYIVHILVNFNSTSVSEPEAISNMIF